MKQYISDFAQPIPGKKKSQEDLFKNLGDQGRNVYLAMNLSKVIFGTIYELSNLQNTQNASFSNQYPIFNDICLSDIFSSKKTQGRSRSAERNH